MVDFNGSGGLAGTSPFANFVGGGPAMSAGQINASMGYNPNANPYDPFAQSGGFGAMTDYYSGLGAAYGRNIGPQMTDNIYGVSGDTWSRMSPSDRSQFNAQMGGSGGGGGGGGGGGYTYPSVDPTPDVGAGSPGGTPFGGGYGIGQGAPQANANQTGSSGRDNLAGLLWGGTNSNNGGGNTYGVDAGTWNSMSAADRNTFNGQMARSGASASAGANAGGSSNAPPYQGNPYYMPQPMQGGSPFQAGGGLGQPGFPGGGGSGFPGVNFGMGIGSSGPGSVGQAYGTIPSNNPFTGQPGYGFGGLEGGQSPFTNLPGS